VIPYLFFQQSGQLSGSCFFLNSSVEKFVEKQRMNEGKISVLNVFGLFALM
jgi:hypothetical protein